MKALFRGLGWPMIVAAMVVALVSSAVAPSAYAATLALDITGKATGSYTGSNGFGTPAFSFDTSSLVRLASGTGAGQADLLYAGERTLAASATENLDLAGALTDPLGSTLTFAKVKAIIIIANAANTNDVVVGGASSNAFTGPFGGTTPTVSVKPGGVFMIAHPGAGWAVTASTADLLKILNSGAGTSVTYKVLIVGTSV